MTNLKAADVQRLRASLRGQLLEPSDPAYEEARSIWNGMIDRRPALIARCLGAADVVEGVKFARETGLPLSIKGGGHNIAGLSVADGALTLDMSLMRGVWVDPTSRTAVAQAGCLLGDVDRETQTHGLAAVLGFVSKTGIAGLTLGGGFGYLTRRYGWTCDNLMSVDLVTAEGRLVRASERENQDLFWGLCGGGGNFGVATSFQYTLYPVGPEIVGGVVAWPGDQARKVLDLYRSVVEEAPPEMTAFAILRPAPPAPWLPESIHGKPMAGIGICHTGHVEKAERDVASVKSYGSPVGDVLERRPYTQQQSLLDATQPSGRRYYWKSEYLASLEPDLLDKMVEHGNTIGSPHSAVLLFAIGGALNRLPEGHSPAGNRDARVVLNVAASWESPSDDDANLAWARGAWEDMRGFSTGGTYINFQTEDEADDRVRSAYGEANLTRLAKVKAAWDPENFFRLNKNIPPKA